MYDEYKKLKIGKLYKIKQGYNRDLYSSIRKYINSGPDYHINGNLLLEIKKNDIFLLIEIKPCTIKVLYKNIVGYISAYIMSIEDKLIPVE